MITFTIYLSNKLTFSLTPLISCSSSSNYYLFKECDLTSQFTQFMQSTQFKPINKHQRFKPKDVSKTKPLCKVLKIVNCSKSCRIVLSN